MKLDMNFTGVSDDDCNAIVNVLVEANKRRAKERVRERKAVESYYWQQVWKSLGITMFWGAILAIVLAAIVCSIDFISRLFLCR